MLYGCYQEHDDVIKLKHFTRYWTFVRGIHRSPVNSPHKGQWRGALMFSLICPWTNRWVNNLNAGDLRRNRAHYNVSVMYMLLFASVFGALVSPASSTDMCGHPYRIMAGCSRWPRAVLKAIRCSEPPFIKMYYHAISKPMQEIKAKVCGNQHKTSMILPVFYSIISL